MPSPSRKGPSTKSRPAPRKPVSGRSKAPAKPKSPPPRKAPPKPAPKKPAKSSAPKPAASPAASPAPEPRRSDSRRHLLSLAFLRDGDEFLARLETDGGQITELKNRSLDQLLTLVAGELEDLLE